MYVRCTHCGYDNSPEYRFCGMCGASLAHPPVATAAANKETPRPGATTPPSSVVDNGDVTTETVHGPSFLGLAEDPKTEFHYLYEDEPPRSHVGLIFAFILLIGIGGFGYWQFKHNGYPFNRLNLENKPAQTASPSEVAPAQSQEQQTSIPKPMTGAGDVQPIAPDQNAKPPDTGKTTEFPPQGGQTPAHESNAGKTPPERSEAGESPNQTGTQQEEAKATPPPTPTTKKPAPTRTSKAAAGQKPATVAAAPAPASPDADLELAGEKYLYGTGLPQNCTKAESALRTAATRGNSKAQTVLGTMYATGHCVGRDLPTAYRWFARALRQDPQNSRISADLQVLWRQMTPQEKQLATSSGQ